MLSTKLRKMDHFGVVANKDGTPRLSDMTNDDDLSSAYDVGAVALGFKPMSIVSHLGLTKDTAMYRGKWLERAVRAAVHEKVQYITSKVMIPRKRWWKVTAVIFHESKFYEAVAMALISFTHKRLIPVRYEEYIIGTQLGYPERDILARYAWRETCITDEYPLSQDSLKRFRAGFPRARERFMSIAKAATSCWNALLTDASFRKLAETYRPMVQTMGQ